VWFRNFYFIFYPENVLFSLPKNLCLVTTQKPRNFDQPSFNRVIRILKKLEKNNGIYSSIDGIQEVSGSIPLISTKIGHSVSDGKILKSYDFRIFSLFLSRKCSIFST
nr:hypothetical protein [Lachnospiraceae bacterium]